MNEVEKLQVALDSERDKNAINDRELGHWVRLAREREKEIERLKAPSQIAQASADADLDMVAKRCIELESMLKECVEAMEYAVNHEHDAMWHDADNHHSNNCQFCARIDPAIYKAKEMLK